MSSGVYPLWVRVLDLLVGLAIVIVSLWIVFDTALAQRAIVLSIAVVLLVVGIIRFAKGIFMSQLDTKSRITKGVLGLGAALLSMAVVIFPELTISFIVALVTFAIILAGISRLVIGYTEKELAPWARGLYVLGGGFTFSFGFIAAIVPGLGFLTLVLLLAAAMMTLGIIRIISGITGEIR
ncbi:MAG: DUF308 domain-containing protein [Candidatus Hodarchaeota archaeon]